MKEQISEREIAKNKESYKNRLIDQQTTAWWKWMDLWVQRLLKDCESYITLFWLLIAGMAFIYNQVFWSNCLDLILKIIYFTNFVFIIIGIIRSFTLRQRISTNIEDYYKNNADILKKEIEELTKKKKNEEYIKDLLELFNLRRQTLDKLSCEYKINEKWLLIKKNIIFWIYILTLTIFIILLWFFMFT